VALAGLVDAQDASSACRYARTVTGGSMTDLLRSLDPQVVYTSDGGGKVTAARRPIVGAENVIRFLQGLITNFSEGHRIELITVNGRSALGICDSKGLNSVVTLTLDSDRITRIDMIRAPDKLVRVENPK
jgi:RNA polymerase sigma-70 factor, ECF subfamily